MKKILFITPHLSTGGQPQYILKKIEQLAGVYDIYCVEYSYLSSQYVVQRNLIKKLLNNKFISIQERRLELYDIIQKIKPDIIWIEEFSETFLKNEECKFIYDKNRNWKIFETTHTSQDLTNKKIFLPDKFIFVSDWSEKQYKNLGVDISVLQYPVDIKIKQTNFYKNKLNFDRNKKHILCVGLFTPGKNQSYIFDLAKKIGDDSVVFHFVGNLAPNFSEYWKPLLINKPDNCIIHGERDNVEEFIQACDLFLFPSKFELNPLVIKEALCYNLPILMFNLETYCGYYDQNENITFLSGDIITDTRLIIKNMNTTEFKEKLISDINIIEGQNKETKKNNINLHFVGNPFLEITGDVEEEYVVNFFDKEELIHNTILKNNMWTKLNRKYYTNWYITVTNSKGIKIFEKNINLEKRRVYISLCSKSLGDTLAWMPYTEEFRKKHNCELIVSTFMNELFIENYPNIKFINPGDVAKDLYAMYELGWFYNDNNEINYNRAPNNFRTQPLQKTATDILGLDYIEIQPKLKKKPNVIKNKKVGIAIHGTSQAKYWNNVNGWQKTVDYLKEKGYDVILYSLEKDGYMGNKHPEGIIQFPKNNLQNVIYDLQSCEFFIGIGSGLSWLAWSLDIPLILISGFSEKYTETQKNTYRIINNNVCTGCFNSHKLDANDWNWCPINKNTSKQFECTKNITEKTVIEQIDKLINKCKT